MVGHVGQHHHVLQQGEHGVHAGLAVGVVTPVAIRRRQDARKVDNQEHFLVPQ